MLERAQPTLQRDRVMRRLIERAPACALAPAADFSPFAALARAIVFQQLNGAAASTIFGRFTNLCAGGGSLAPPQLALVSDAELRGCGLSAGKTRALRDLTAKCLDGTVPSASELQSMSDAAIVERLGLVRGVGRWTAEMLLMFHLGREDILPVNDFGVRMGAQLAYGLRRMPTPRGLADFGERWLPYRSVAAWYLWRAVDLERAGKLGAFRGKPPSIELEKARPRAKSPARRRAKKRAAAGRSAGK